LQGLRLMASTDLIFEDEDAAQHALLDVRKNHVKWALFTYSSSQNNTIILVGSGQGGLEELKTHLTPDNICYGLVRVEERIDESNTVKFVFVIWCGEKVPFMKKAKMTTHKGSIVSLMGQYHIDIHASSLEELTDESISRKVKDAAGTSIHVKDGPKEGSPATATASSTATSTRAAPTSTKPVAKGGAKPSVPQGGGTLNFVDADQIKAAIAAVRSDSDETDWVLFGYEGNSNNIKLVGRGNCGLDELIPHLKDDEIIYGLYRTTDTVDNTVAVKFVLILWVGEKVKTVRKARITTHKGEVTSFVGQYHVDINCSNLNEINDELIRDLVAAASGTKVNVK